MREKISHLLIRERLTGFYVPDNPKKAAIEWISRFRTATGKHPIARTTWVPGVGTEARIKRVGAVVVLNGYEITLTPQLAILLERALTTVGGIKFDDVRRLIQSNYAADSEIRARVAKLKKLVQRTTSQMPFEITILTKKKRIIATVLQSAPTKKLPTR